MAAGERIAPHVTAAEDRSRTMTKHAKRRAATCIGGTAFALGALLASAGNVEMTSAVSRVVVYPGWARVERRGEADLQAGMTRVVFPGLPRWLDVGSVQARAEGQEGVRAVAARGRVVVRGARTDEDLEQAEKAATEVQDSIDAVKAEVEMLGAERAYLDKLMPWRVEALPTETAARPVTAAELKEVNDYLAQARVENGQKTGEANRRLRALQEELEEKEKARDEIKGLMQVRQGEVAVDVRAPSAGKAVLSVSYLVGGASWFPEHTLSEGAGSGTVALETYAVVQQATGEEWREAEVVVSAGHPYASTHGPALGAWGLQPPAGSGPVSVPFGSRTLGEFDARLLALSKTWQEDAAEDETLADAVPLVLENSKQASELVRQTAIRGGGVVRTAAGRHAVETTGAATLVPLGAVEVPIARTFRLMPSISTQCYEVGVLRNASDAALLPGPMNITRGGDLLTQRRLDLTGPGERFEVDLGASDAMSAVRTLDRGGSRITRLGATTRLTVAYRVRLKNGRDTEVLVQVRDQLPSVGKDQGVAVELLAAKPRAEVGADGVVVWETSVAAGGGMELSFAFRLEYPSDRVPAVAAALEKQVLALTEGAGGAAPGA